MSWSARIKIDRELTDFRNFWDRTYVGLIHEHGTEEARKIQKEMLITHHKATKGKEGFGAVLKFFIGNGLLWEEYTQIIRQVDSEYKG